MSALPAKIVLKSTTSKTLNDRFTEIARQIRSPPQVTLGGLRMGQVQQAQASAKNRRLAAQMANRPGVQAALGSPPKGGKVQNRLGNQNKGSVQGRLGAGFRQANRGGQGTIQQRIGSGRGGMRRGMGIKRGGTIRGKPIRGGMTRGVGRGMRGGRGGRGKPQGGRGGGVSRGGATRGRGGIRGGRSRGRGRGRGGQTNPTKSKDALDKELDEYMTQTKGHLDAELDQYMQNIGSDE